MKKTAGISLFLMAALAWHDAAQAEDAPAPRRMPRVPVTVQDNHDVAPPSHQVQGTATIIDGEKLRVAETDIRLFGIVPPQLAASFGPQARSALDTLVGTQTVSCQIRDRDRDGRLLATCQSSNGNDLALDLLKRGLAVTARGSLVGTDLATPYITAEQNAQNQKLGLWSINIPAATSATAPVSAPAPHQEAVAVPAPVAKEDKVAPRTDKAADAQAQQSATQAKIAADIINQHAQSGRDDDQWAQEEQTGFFERYQILIAGFLMMGTALSIIGALWAQKRRDKIDETKAVAAALRGELMAARGVCMGRLKNITGESEDKLAIWPRIRATLYSAYVGRLGLLGAELARQVASIYGQASDYAALYSGTVQETPKKNALETLVKHIDEVLPKLAAIEQAGSYAASVASAPAPRVQPRSPYDAAPVARPVVKPTPPATEAAVAAATASSEEEYVPVTPQSYAAPTANPTVRQSAALWETVRGFIQNHRNAIAQPTAAQPHPLDPDMHEYTAIIEADMARYQYGDNVETLDISPNKPPKSRSSS